MMDDGWFSSLKWKFRLLLTPDIQFSWGHHPTPLSKGVGVGWGGGGDTRGGILLAVDKSTNPRVIQRQFSPYTLVNLVDR